MVEIEVDRLRNLPDSLLFRILLKFPTKFVVKTSVLSKKWRNLWRYVPALELDRFEFPAYNDFVRFVDSYLRFDRETLVEKFVLKYNGCDLRDDFVHIGRCINIVAMRNMVKHLHFSYDRSGDFAEMPPTIYTCESLVSLNLSAVMLPSIEFVTLPSLKVMDFHRVSFADSLVLETLISQCPVLESLSITSILHIGTKVLRVCSHSLLSFVYVEHRSVGVAIDAPRLEYLNLYNCESDIIILNNPTSLVEVDIYAEFNLGGGKRLYPNDLQKRSMIRNFLLGISSVKDMVISSNTLEVFYDYSRFEPLPLFRNLAFLRVKFYHYNWKLLPFFLESCPYLKSLVVGFDSYMGMKTVDILLPGSQCSLASLEYIEIERPFIGKEMVMKLVSYLLEKSTNLKKLTLPLGDFQEQTLGDFKEQEESVILEKLIAIPRVSSVCQVIIR